jgi:hypothetical protein
VGEFRIWIFMWEGIRGLRPDRRVIEAIIQLSPPATLPHKTPYRTNRLKSTFGAFILLILWADE